VLSDSDQPSPATRLAALAGSLLLGVVTGGIGTFAHQSSWPVVGIRVPLGLITALVAVGCLVAGLRLVLGSRLHAGVAAAGIIAAIGLLALPGPSGSALLPANPAGVAWTVGPAFLIAIVLGWPNLPARHDSSAPKVRWNTDGGEDSIQ
jgi:N-acetyl-1-D-myo-inositol-2-amino-2-deoxy-alpha-D-glucopyranoside deacetylase